MLRPELRRELEQALSGKPGAGMITDVRPVGGGCISTTLCVQLAGGGRAFVKLAPDASPGPALLGAEAIALAVLRAAGRVRVPQVLAIGPEWLALEWLEPGPAAPDTWAGLGRELAELHRVQGPGFGWAGDNFIGSLPQANGWSEDWAGFWWARRLEPQLQQATAAGLLTAGEARAFERLSDQLPELLEAGQADGPSLLHGDLWHGNVHLLAGGGAALVDPAACYGHREVDLAMAALFGGFPAGFFRSYQESWPLEPRGLEQRRACYQLYYLLVHVNLFGRGYLAGARAALERALQA